jgi:hypothetical protein
MNLAFQLNNSKALILAYQLGYRNNKKPGEGMAEELLEVSKRHPEWVTIIGKTSMDADLLAGNMRESGIKVRNLNEEKKNEEIN